MHLFYEVDDTSSDQMEERENKIRHGYEDVKKFSQS